MPTATPNISDTAAALSSLESVAPDSLAIDSLAIDSLAIDSLAIDSLKPQELSAKADTVAAIAPPAWLDGLKPTMRQIQPGNHSGFLLIIAVLFAAMIFNFKHLKRLIKTYIEELWKVRSGRDNIFDEHPAGDTRILLLLILQCIICSGILLSIGICRFTQPADTHLTSGCILGVTAVAAACYLIHFIGYHVVGFAFASSEMHRDWVRSYNASIALLGMTLIVPAMLAIFYPQAADTAAFTAIVLYLCTKISFILKGFRIFYTNFSSLIYFILYLCTLEIMPLLFVYRCSVLIAEQALKV